MKRARFALLAALLSAVVASVAPAATFIIDDGEDSAPYSFLPLLSRGEHTTLYAFDSVDGGISHAFETYLRFALPPGLLGPGETVTQAHLVVTYGLDFVGFGDTTHIPGSLVCRRVDGAWSEATLTWSSRPPLGPAVDSVSNIDELQVIDFDVTSLVRDWATGAVTNNGFALTSPTARVMGFYSWEAFAADPNLPLALRATLVIQTGVLSPNDDDGDTILNGSDNCRYESNTNQLDNGKVGGAGGDGIGNVCQCADGDDDGNVMADDVTAIRSQMVGLAPLLAPAKCNARGPVDAADSDANNLRDDCSMVDVVVTQRALGGKGPGIAQGCAPAMP